MSKVFVFDTDKQPLNPVHPGRARTLLSSGKAAVFKHYPFTIILKSVVERPHIEPLRMKFDPGSKTTGIAIVNDALGEVVFAAELTHRGQAIKSALDDRRAIRRSRRQRKTRYRFPRWRKHPNNTRNTNPKGWLPPSLESRISNVVTWGRRLMRLCPIADISQELVRFDTQLMDNAEISGVGYQQGTLAGTEVREYLLEKWNRTCAYCGAKNVPLEIEHIHPRSQGGSDRISNLCIACVPCNQAKGNQDIKDFLAKKPDVLKRILAQAKAPLKDVAAVNATRWALFERLKELELPIECGTGGRTKYNRTARGLDKAHWIDAACVGASTPETVNVQGVKPLLIKAMGTGCRQKCAMNKYGFPRTGPKGSKRLHGYQTGDIIRATIPKGRNAGVHVGRMIMQSSGTFYFGSGKDRIQFSYKYCTPLHRNDGYSYPQ
jgi:5-methylcytosine-specific restriction endonuclease McrA